MISAVLFQACRQEELDCGTLRRQAYQQPNHRIDGALVHFNFTDRDTTYFPYSGVDTLTFLYEDSLGITDTINYIGQGREISYDRVSPSASIPDECNTDVLARVMKIRYKPSNTSKKEIIFQLTGGNSGGYFYYLFDSNHLNGSVNLLEWTSMDGYRHVFDYKGHVYHEIIYFSKEIKGHHIEYCIGKHDQLIMYQIDSSVTYSKVN